MTRDRRLAVEGHIKTRGQHVVCVHSAPREPLDFQPFVYTIGNLARNLPELLLIGASDEIYGHILNIIGQVQRDRRKPLAHGEIVDFTAGVPAKIVDGGRRGREEYAVQAGVFFRVEAFEVRQVLLPDENGVYPDQPGCLPPYSDQPVLSATH